MENEELFTNYIKKYTRLTHDQVSDLAYRFTIPKEIALQILAKENWKMHESGIPQFISPEVTDPSSMISGTAVSKNFIKKQFIELPKEEK